MPVVELMSTCRTLTGALKFVQDLKATLLPHPRVLEYIYITDYIVSPSTIALAKRSDTVQPLFLNMLEVDKM
jgi:hypothetical protein